MVSEGGGVNKQTLDALIASAEKWERNAVASKRQVKLGPENCALCELFFDNDCLGCPVESGGHFGCQSTPYDYAEVAMWNWGNSPRSKVAREEFRRAAAAEAKFLRSLIPAEGATA